MTDNKKLIIESAEKVLKIEAQEILNAVKFIDENFTLAVQEIFHAKGKLILSGVGKSGHIARKIASTLSSTGTPSLFMHPSEASHGDLGIITEEDVILFFSNSGQSDEIYNLIPSIKRLNISMIAITGNEKSELAKQADFHISSSVTSEACPLGLAPTASSAVMLAIGDAIAISLLKLNGFDDEDFRRSHPGGSLGKNKLIKVDDIMQKVNDLPLVKKEATLSEVISLITDKKSGFAVVTSNQKPIGFFTDGDFRRAMLENTSLNKPVGICMSANPITISQDEIAINAANLMELNKISSLIVINNTNQLSGVIHFQDLLINKII